MLRGLLRKREWTHERCEAVYGSGLSVGVESGLSRSDAVCLARLRSGHCLELGACRVRFGLSEDGLCRFCLCVPESVDHVFACDSGRVMRGVLGLAGGLGICVGCPWLPWSTGGGGGGGRLGDATTHTHNDSKSSLKQYLD